MNIRKQLESIGRDPQLTLDFIECLRIRANRKAKRDRIIGRLIKPFTFWKGVTL